jgi:BMFP domain-containing protein YqiC
LDEEFNAELKVTQPENKSDLEARIKALEKKLNTHLESENNNK